MNHMEKCCESPVTDLKEEVEKHQQKGEAENNLVTEVMQNSLETKEIKKNAKEGFRDCNIYVIPRFIGGKCGSRQKEMRDSGTGLLGSASAGKVDTRKSWKAALATSHKGITNPERSPHVMWHYR